MMTKRFDYEGFALGFFTGIGTIIILFIIFTGIGLENKKPMTLINEENLNCMEEKTGYLDISVFYENGTSYPIKGLVSTTVSQPLMEEANISHVKFSVETKTVCYKCQDENKNEVQCQ